MNVNQLLNMVMRLFLRKAINGGLSAGMKRMGGGAGRRGAKVPPGAGQAPVSGAARAPDSPGLAQDQQAIRKARQAARAARRSGRG